MERKFNQEKALREVAETRVKALKKKIRMYENNPNNNNNNTTNGSNSSITLNTIHNPNDISMDAGYGTQVGSGTGIGTTKDDESVGTNQTHDKLLLLPPPPPHLPPPLQYSDQLL